MTRSLVFSLLLSAILLDGLLNLDQWLSILGVFSGVVVSQWHKPEQPVNEIVDAEESGL